MVDWAQIFIIHLNFIKFYHYFEIQGINSHFNERETIEYKILKQIKTNQN
jgi:hypothetical protein